MFYSAPSCPAILLQVCMWSKAGGAASSTNGEWRSWCFLLPGTFYWGTIMNERLERKIAFMRYHATCVHDGFCEQVFLCGPGFLQQEKLASDPSPTSKKTWEGITSQSSKTSPGMGSSIHDRECTHCWQLSWLKKWFFLLILSLPPAAARQWASPGAVIPLRRHPVLPLCPPWYTDLNMSLNCWCRLLPFLLLASVCLDKPPQTS